MTNSHTAQYQDRPRSHQLFGAHTSSTAAKKLGGA